MDEIARIAEIPGMDQTSAKELLAEIGVDMEVFPTEGHLASWAGVCPGNNESAGKKKLENEPWEQSGESDSYLARNPYSFLSTRFHIYSIKNSNPTNYASDEPIAALLIPNSGKSAFPNINK